MESQENPIEIDENITQDQLYKEEIKMKISSMKNSTFRTTNFSLIEYFVKNDFKTFKQEELILLLLNDYKKNPNKYILAKDKGNFKNEKSFKTSIKFSICRNKSFIKGPGPDDLSLNLEKTVQYLRAMRQQYERNSSDISTPFKLFNKSDKKSKKVQSMTKITKFNGDKLHSKANMDFLEPMENSKINMTFLNTTGLNINASNNFTENSQNQFTVEKLNNEVIYLSNSSSPSNSKTRPNNSEPNNNKNVGKNGSEKDSPEIFHKRLFSDVIISSFNKDNIFKICNSFDEYLSTVKSKKMNYEIQNELEIISQSIKEIYNTKTKYNIACGEIKDCQKELLKLYKLIKNQIKFITVEIELKSYSFEVYSKMKDTIFKLDKSYNKTLESIETLLIELIDAEKILAFNRRNILDHLNNLKNKGFCDFTFSRLVNMIENELKFNSSSLNNKLNKYLMKEENNIYSISLTILKGFKNEKKNIIDKFTYIDSFIGNITCY